MTVAFDALSSTVLGSPGPDTWTHSPVGTPRGILVFVLTPVNEDQYKFTDVTYGGVPLVRLTVPFLTSGTPEGGTGLIYFLGSNIPTGDQTVSVDYAADPTTQPAYCISVTGAGDTRPVDFGFLTSGSVENPSIALDSGAYSALRFFGGETGDATADSISGIAGTTVFGSKDIGSRGFVWGRETTASTGETTIGFTIAADDASMVGVAITDEAVGSDPEVDAWSEHPTAGGVGTTPDPFTWTHVPISDPAGVVVAVYQANSADDLISGVSYGGQALTRVNTISVNSTGVGAVYLYLLGSGVPTGSQTVSVDHTATSDVKWAVAVTVAASGDVETSDSATGSSASGTPSVTLDSVADAACRIFATYWQGTDPTVPLSGDTVGIVDNDRGSQGWQLVVTPRNQTGSAAIGVTGTVVYAAAGVALAAGATVPAAPTNPTATAIDSESILVGWDDVADETGYRVERSLNGTSGWTNVSGTLAANTVSYTDTGLDTETTYYYRVIAINAQGDSSPSSTVNATTTAAASANRMGGNAIRKPPRIRR